MEIGVRFMSEDLNPLRHQYGCLGNDGPMIHAMENLRKVYFRPGFVQFSYGVPPHGQPDDPRVNECLLANECRAVRMKKLHDERVEAKKMMRHKKMDPLVRATLAAMGDVMLRNFIASSREEEPPFDIRMYKVPISQICAELQFLDLKVASLGLAFFNAKFPRHPPYILEQVFGYQQTFELGRFWCHANFKARCQDGSPANLFFVEIDNMFVVTFCCILDDIPCVRGCGVCGKAFVHPMDGGFLQGCVTPEGRGERSSS